MDLDILTFTAFIAMKMLNSNWPASQHDLVDGTRMIITAAGLELRDSFVAGRGRVHDDLQISEAEPSLSSRKERPGNRAGCEPSP